MRRPSLLAALAGALAVSLPALAGAQPLGQDLVFTTVTKTSQGGHSKAEQKAITNAADYAAWWNGQPPASPAVDFAKEDVLAVAMGTQPTSGYGIEITRIVRNTGVPGGVVHYTETKPTGIVLMVITAPVHLVKVQKGLVSQYSFVNDSAPAAAWDKLSAGTLDFRSYSARLELQPSGAATLYQSSPTAKYAPLAGQATAAELKAVQAAFAKADVKTLPATIKDPRVFIVAPTTVNLTSTIAGKDYSLDASLDYYPGYETRVKPLVDALRAIGDRLKNPVAPSFDRMFVSTFGGFSLFNTSITVSKDGATTVDRTSPRQGSAKLYTGQATAAELQAVKDAFAAADVTTLPATIDDPAPIMDIPAQRIVSTVGGRDYTVDVTKAHRYMSYEPRLGPLVAAIGAIADRIILEQDGTSLTGVVSTNAQGAVWVGTTVITGSSRLRALIATQKGKTVVVQVHAKRVGAVAMAEPIWLQGWTRANLNLRTGPSTSFKILTTLGKGSGVQVTNVSSDARWLKADAAGYTGYVSRTYVRLGN